MLLLLSLSLLVFVSLVIFFLLLVPLSALDVRNILTLGLTRRSLVLLSLDLLKGHTDDSFLDLGNLSSPLFSDASGLDLLVFPPPCSSPSNFMWLGLIPVNVH